MSFTVSFRLVSILLLWAGIGLSSALGAEAPTSAVSRAETESPSRVGSDESSAAKPWRLAVNLEGAEKAGEVSVGVQIVVVMTLLSLAPAMVMLMTSFTRIVVVLGFLRTAIGLPNAPANQIITGLALFLTLFIMGPTIDRVNSEAIQPYLGGTLSSSLALDAASVPVKDFMLKQTRTRDLEFFLRLGRFPPTAVKDLPLRVVVPAFVISELHTAFQMEIGRAHV